ncbi:MAG: GerMN domain-containing protein [bacterium]|nr:GerMN domain-containing protein [bacterium]
MKFPTIHVSKTVSVFGVMIVALLLSAWWIGEDRTQNGNGTTIEEAQEEARSWITQESPTYLFDGSDLQLEEERVIEEGKSYEFAFLFISSSAGYGDRADEMVAQVITPHVTRVVVTNGVVVSAITDNVYSELEEKMIEQEAQQEEVTGVAVSKTMIVRVFFGKEGSEEVYAVERVIPATLAVAGASMRELLQGPNERETAKGYFTSVPKGVELRNLFIENGVAYADFSKELQANVAGSARVLAIQNQIVQTLFQFSTVQSVVISVDGVAEGILQP